MLVLSRKNLESLFIKVPMQDGTEKTIKVQVVGAGGKGKVVRLGVEADRDVTILRQELLEKVQENNAAK
jgi:carbon storage regulator CsrA